MDRLGCPDTDHDIRKLMRHRFFKGINFKTNLAETTDIRKALADSEIESVLKQLVKLNLNTKPSEAAKAKIELDQNV